MDLIGGSKRYLFEWIRKRELCRFQTRPGIARNNIQELVKRKQGYQSVLNITSPVSCIFLLSFLAPNTYSFVLAEMWNPSLVAGKKSAKSASCSQRKATNHILSKCAS
jgi:hypothetical protein